MPNSRKLFRAWGLLSVLWLVVALMTIVNQWSGDRVSSRAFLITYEQPAIGEACTLSAATASGVWPDGERMPPEVLADKYGDYIRRRYLPEHPIFEADLPPEHMPTVLGATRNRRWSRWEQKRGVSLRPSTGMEVTGGPGGKPSPR
jgi:hypothetical protein